VIGICFMDTGIWDDNLVVYTDACPTRLSFVYAENAWFYSIKHNTGGKTIDILSGVIHGLHARRAPHHA
jgi:hypothetical protein